MLSSSASLVDDRLDGCTAAELAERLALPRVVLLASCPSTLDVAHRLAGEGADAGTLVIADAQTAGRGRLGRQWSSEAGGGLWLTLVERRIDDHALRVLSLRAGLLVAEALDPLTDDRVGVKWPNDLLIG
ncbi:MAG: biotin--[acetyl-CoA-carboxylase] ligase, partial [Gemmatimonadaceae bacterium]|nr:biotin--[acetyl-CoA-carboxylase] ligase [Gemmatimonadaceae bacterium]